MTPAPTTADLIEAMRAPGLLAQQPAVQALSLQPGMERLRAVCEDIKRRFPSPEDRPALTLIQGGNDAG
jgi:hypothetical protein